MTPRGDPAFVRGPAWYDVLAARYVHTHPMWEKSLAAAVSAASNRGVGPAAVADADTDADGGDDDDTVGGDGPCGGDSFALLSAAHLAWLAAHGGELGEAVLVPAGGGWRCSFFDCWRGPLPAVACPRRAGTRPAGAADHLSSCRVVRAARGASSPLHHRRRHRRIPTVPPPPPPPPAVTTTSTTTAAAAAAAAACTATRCMASTDCGGWHGVPMACVRPGGCVLTMCRAMAAWGGDACRRAQTRATAGGRGTAVR